jgi:hypothetical protein
MSKLTQAARPRRRPDVGKLTVVQKAITGSVGRKMVLPNADAKW